MRSNVEAYYVTHDRPALLRRLLRFTEGFELWECYGYKTQTSKSKHFTAVPSPEAMSALDSVRTAWHGPGGGCTLSTVHIKNYLSLDRVRYLPTTEMMLALTEDTPFLYMAANSGMLWEVDRDPLRPDTPKYHCGPSFGDGMNPHHWFAAFLGERGHERLASRRLLRYGPWRLIERPGDLSIVELHDPAADELVAFEQSKPGQMAMGITDVGAYIHPVDKPTEDRDWGMYNKTTRSLEKVVASGELHAWDLRVYAAAKMYQPFDFKLDDVVWVFLDEDNARKHLHLIWCWGMRVRTFVDGREVDLTDDYEPPPPVELDWVKKRRDEDGF